MKIAKTLLTLSLLISSQASFADNSSTTKESEIKTSSPSFEVSTNPLYLLISGANLNLDYQVGNRLKFGLGVIYLPMKERFSSDTSTSSSLYNYKDSYFQRNLYAKVMLTGANNQDGFYFKPEYGKYTAKIEDFGSDKLSGQADTDYVGAIIGYQWVYRKGFRLSLGGGLIRTLGDYKVVIRENDGTKLDEVRSRGSGGLNLDANFGYIF